MFRMFLILPLFLFLSSLNAKEDSCRVQIGKKYYPIKLVPIANNSFKIAYLDLKSNPHLVEALAQEIATYIRSHRKKIDILVTPEANTISLAYAIHKKTGIDYVILSKKQRPNMGEKAVFENVKSITTDTLQKLWLSEDDKKKIENKNVLILDDVISTGNTIRAMEKLVQQAGGVLSLPPLVGFYEGSKWDNITAISPTILPLTPITHSPEVVP